MHNMNYFIPNDTFDNAIKNKEKGVLKALLIGIIGSDPTFATSEYAEATAYVKATSEKLNGSSINLSEPYIEQEDEYTKTPDNWDEEYYRMLLVWYRDNYADERLTNIKSVGKEVYKNKLTLGKAKRQNRLSPQKETVNKTSTNTHSPKKAPVVMAAGNDVRKTRLPIGEWFKQNWKWVAAIAAVIAAVIAVIAIIVCLLSNK